MTNITQVHAHQSLPSAVLQKPVKWCFRQFQELSTLKHLASQCQLVAIAQKVALAALALIALLPSGILAGLEWCLKGKPQIRYQLKPEKAKEEVTKKDEAQAKNIDELLQAQAALAFSHGEDAFDDHFGAILPSPQIKVADHSLQQPIQAPIKQEEKEEPIAPAKKVKHPPIEDELHFASGDALFWEASQHFEIYEMHKDQSLHFDFSELGPYASDEAIINALLSHSQGFCVGEIHEEAASKRFLIENMAYLKCLGVKILFFEGIDYQNEQKLIDRYMADEVLTASEQEQLQNIMGRILNFIGPQDSPHTAFGILAAAKECGIRVVGIDYSLALEEKKIEFEPRIARMNYVAWQIMKKEMASLEPQDKFAAHMGLSHLCRDSDTARIPGVAELFDCPAIVLRDKARKEIAERTVHYESEESTRVQNNMKIESPLHIEIAC
jgi:hypothetical protein